MHLKAPTLAANSTLDSRVAVVIPVHPPKFAFARRFVASVERCDQLANFRHYFVFSNSASWKALVRSDEAVARVVSHLVVCVPDTCKNVCAPAWKKLSGVAAVFSGRPHGIYHDLALVMDAETEYQSRLPFHDWFSKFVSNRVLVGYRRADNLQPRQTMAGCAALHLKPLLPYFFHWADVPLYERRDFGGFVDRFDWKRAFEGDLGGYIFDEVSYACYKLRVGNWSMIDAGEVNMEQASVAQQHALEATHRNYNSGFLWSREKDPSRLFLFHRDRKCTGECTSPPDCAAPSLPVKQTPAKRRPARRQQKSRVGASLSCRRLPGGCGGKAARRRGIVKK